MAKILFGMTATSYWRVADGNLYTGQNPASAAPLAQELLKVLG